MWESFYIRILISIHREKILHRLTSVTTDLEEFVAGQQRSGRLGRIAIVNLPVHGRYVDRLERQITLCVWIKVTSYQVLGWTI